MYQDRLLAEYRAPKNRRIMSSCTHRAVRSSPVCGDHFTVMVHVVQDRIADVSFTGQGCSIAVASASLMTQCLAGTRVSDAQSTVAKVEQLLRGASTEEMPEWLEPLRGVVPFAGRHGCVMLPWNALGDALHDALNDSQGAPRSTARVEAPGAKSAAKFE